MKKSGWMILPAAFFLLLNLSNSNVKALFYSRLIYFFFLISLFLFLRRFNLKKILVPIVGGISCILFIFGLIQKYILFPLYLNYVIPENNFYSQALLSRIKSGRIFSIFTLPTLYAIICAVLILFLFHYFLKANTFKIKVFWGVAIVLGTINLILTQSFGGILYLSAGIIVYLFISGIVRFKYIAPIVMVFFLFFFLLVGIRFQEARKLEPVKLRYSNWKQAVRMIEASPLLGMGLGNYQSKISYYTLPGEAKSIYAHNFFLQFISETGIILPFFLLLLLFLSRKKLKINNPGEKVCYLSALVIILFYNFIDIGLYFFSAGLITSIILSQVYPNPSGKIHFRIGILALLGFLLWVEYFSDSMKNKADFWFNQNDF
jgi:O-antigen ligase